MTTQKTSLPIIQSLWAGKELSTMERLCIESFIQNGHPFHLYVYDDVKGVPDKTILKDASDILPSSAIFKYKDYDSYAGFSNLFRYKLLAEKGSWWVDTDTICLKPFSVNTEYLFSSEYFHPSKIKKGTPRNKTNNGIVKVPKNSELMDYCYQKADKADKGKLDWGEIGPQLITSATKKFHFEEYIAHPYDFCPVNWWEFRNLISPSLLITLKEKAKMIIGKSFAIHLWNEMWRRNNINKDANYPKNCIYEQLKRRYLQ